MRNIGILELTILFMAAAAVIGAYVLAINKLLKSRLSSYQKIVWIIIMIGFHVLGLVAFLIYHDNYLSPELRANS
jgi:hypothetical protein